MGGWASECNEWISGNSHQSAPHWAAWRASCCHVPQQTIPCYNTFCCLIGYINLVWSVNTCIYADISGGSALQAKGQCSRCLFVPCCWYVWSQCCSGVSSGISMPRICVWHWVENYLSCIKTVMGRYIGTCCLKNVTYRPEELFIFHVLPLTSLQTCCWPVLFYLLKFINKRIYAYIIHKPLCSACCIIATD